MRHSIRVDEGKCKGCVACMHACPMKAIRVRGGRAVILDDRCIDCGVCIEACPEAAVMPVTTSYADLDAFRYTIAIPSPALYGQFGMNVLPNAILLGLRQIGFDQVYDEAWTCEMVTSAVELYAREHAGPRPLISPTCPVVVRLIQIRFPSLVESIVPIETPREIAARDLKSRACERFGLRESEVGVIYITPCAAKMVAINSPPTKEKSHLDGAVSISDIYGKLLSAMPASAEGTHELVLQQSSGVGIGWATSGGEVAGLKIENSLAVAGISNVIDVLDELDTGRLKDVSYLECRACDLGCVGGQLTVENRYIAHRKVMTLVRMFGEHSRVSLEQVGSMYEAGYFSFEKQVFATPMEPLAGKPVEAIERAKIRNQIAQTLKGIDCGACGSPDCATFAEDVVRGLAKIEDCVFKRLEVGRERIGSGSANESG